MTTPRVEKIGYCAHESKEGDWAFELALKLARQLDAPLNVFGFLMDPYQSTKPKKTAIPSVDEEELVRIEKALRFRYEEAAGDYLNVGFRLCHDNAWRELHRCLCRREFQILVLANPSKNAYFLGEPIHQFLKTFICPTIFVGPGRKDRLLLNHAANLIKEQLRLPRRRTVKQPGADHASEYIY
jgi:hypothetical protein